MEYRVWETLGNRMLENDYAKYYFTPEKYEAENPLENLVVPEGVEAFFGPRVLNLFIVCKPYGWDKATGVWTDFWPPAGYEDSVARHKETFEKFTSYRTIFFIDLNLARKMDSVSAGKSRLVEMLTAVKARLTETCEDLKDYGFEMGPDIESEVGSEFFAPYLDDIFLIN